MQMFEANENKNCLEEFLKLHAKNDNLSVFLYGAGSGMRWYIKLLNKYNVPIEGIIDGKLSGEACYQVDGYFVYSLEKICQKYENAVIVISAPAYRKAIYKRIREIADHYVVVVFDPILDIIQGNSWIERKEYFESRKGELIKLRSILGDDLSKITLDKYLEGLITNSCECYSEIHSSSQYFPDIVMRNLGKNETFVDVGAYVGDSIQEFVGAVSNTYKKVFAFEPDIQNFHRAKETVQDGRIEWYQKGVGEKCGTLYFQNETGDLDEGAHVVTDECKATAQIDIVSLDEFISEEVTYIKMDIEGMELGALRGACKIISEQRPKLAISIYHRTEDIIEIPEYILKLNPNYKLFLRHYWESNGSDTVLFAI